MSSYTQQDLDNADTAIAELVAGKRVTRYAYSNGKQINLAEITMDELLKYRDKVDGEVNLNSGFEFFSFGAM